MLGPKEEVIFILEGQGRRYLGVKWKEKLGTSGKPDGKGRREGGEGWAKK